MLSSIIQINDKREEKNRVVKFVDLYFDANKLEKYLHSVYVVFTHVRFQCPKSFSLSILFRLNLTLIILRTHINKGTTRRYFLRTELQYSLTETVIADVKTKASSNSKNKEFTLQQRGNYSIIDSVGKCKGIVVEVPFFAALIHTI